MGVIEFNYIFSLTTLLCLLMSETTMHRLYYTVRIRSVGCYIMYGSSPRFSSNYTVSVEKKKKKKHLNQKFLFRVTRLSQTSLLLPSTVPHGYPVFTEILK